MNDDKAKFVTIGPNDTHWPSFAAGCMSGIVVGIAILAGILTLAAHVTIH